MKIPTQIKKLTKLVNLKEIKIDLNNLTRKQKQALIVGGVTFALALAIFLFLFSNGYSGLHLHSKAKDGQIKVACVGDSITYGHGISNWAQNNYPAQLQKILGDSYHVQNFGHSGKTVQDSTDQPYTESKQYELSLKYDADILVFMLGSNDSKPECFEDVSTFMAEYTSLIASYKQRNPDIEIIICTPACAFFSDGKTDGETDFKIRPKIVSEMRNYIRSFALANGYKLVDIYDLTQYHPEWFKDNVHPSNDGARAIAEKVAEKIKN